MSDEKQPEKAQAPAERPPKPVAPDIQKVQGGYKKPPGTITTQLDVNKKSPG